MLPLQQAGIPETIVNVVGECPEQAQRWLYRNIVLIGGCSNTPNFRERVEREVRQLAPDTFKVGWLGDPCTREATQVAGRKSRYLEYCIFQPALQ